MVVVGAVDDEEPLPGPRHGHIEHPALLRHRDALVPSLEEVRELVGHRVGEPSAVPVGYHEDVVRLQTLGRVGGEEPDRPYVNPVVLVILPSAVDHVHRSGLTRHAECELAVPVPEGVDVRPGPPYDEHGLRWVDEIQTVGNCTWDVAVGIHRQQLYGTEGRVADPLHILPLLHRVGGHEPPGQVDQRLRTAVGRLYP